MTRGVAAAAVLGLLVMSCGPAPAHTVALAPAESATPTPAPAPTASSAPAPTASSAPAPTASSMASSSETSCRADADCTFVSLGCCSTTPVNRAFAAVVKKRLEASGLPYCHVKAACGQGPNGTWEGVAGVCLAGVCGGGP